MAEADGGGGEARARAGESAQCEYDRRAARDAERRRAGMRTSIVLIAAAPFVGYLLVQAGAVGLDALFESMTSSVEATEPAEPVMSGEARHSYGLIGGLAATVWVISARFGRRQTTEAWRIGAEGERRTAQALESLPSGFHVLHDLRIPDSRANIDHVVVGPTGVFTIETKNYAKGVTIRGGKARSGGRVLDSVVAQAKRQAKVVTERLGTPATPIVCVHGEGVRVEGWFQKPTVGGVRFCSGRRVASVVSKGPRLHDPDTVRSMLAMLHHL